jgi:sec-independent protein translocase protein TatC
MAVHASNGSARLTFWEHVGELQKCLLWGASFFVAASIIIFAFASDTLIGYMLRPAPGGLVFLSPLGPFLFKMKIACFGGLLVSLPLWLVLALRFVGSALKPPQRMFVYLVSLATFLLGVSAIALSYLYLVPVSLKVLAGFTVPGTTLLLTAESYLSFFLLQLMVSFVALEIPIVVIVLSYLRLLDPRILARKRKYVFLVLLIGFAILTPTTDVVTLLLVTLPAYVLCELGIALGKMVYTRAISTK